MAGETALICAAPTKCQATLLGDGTKNRREGSVHSKRFTDKSYTRFART